MKITIGLCAWVGIHKNVKNVLYLQGDHFKQIPITSYEMQYFSSSK